MKKITTLLLGSFLIFNPFTSCNKIKDMIGIQDLLLNAKDIPITIPASAAGQQNATATVQFNLADEINKQNTSGYPLSASNIKSATVNDKKIKSEGFTFLYPTIEAAIEELIAK